MTQVSNAINGIIEDLVDPDKHLKDILLKVQVLAFQLKNERLKDWVNNEQNGYKKNIPAYRRFGTIVLANLIQERPFGGAATRRSVKIDTLNLKDKEVKEMLAEAALGHKVAELEAMANAEDDLQSPQPRVICSVIESTLANQWQVDSCWQLIPRNSIKGILGSIRSTLLEFLLEINEQIGDNQSYSVMDNKKDINKAFDKTIGNISGKTVNINIGDKTQQTNISGKENQTNVGRGKKVDQKIDVDVKENLKSFCEDVKKHIGELNLKKTEQIEVQEQLTLIISQLEKPEPRKGIITACLGVVYDILIEVTASAYSPIILEQLNGLVTRLS